MAAVDPVSPEIQKLFDAKARRRKELAALPWPEKVRILVRMQRMIYPLVRDRDPRACVWKIPEGDDDAQSRRKQ